MPGFPLSRALALLTKKTNPELIEEQHPLWVWPFLDFLPVDRCQPTLSANSYVQRGNGSWWISKSTLFCSSTISTWYRNEVAQASFTETSYCLLSCFLPWWTPTHFSSRYPVVLLEGGWGEEALMEERYSRKGKNELYFSLFTRTSLIKLSAKPFLGWQKVSTSLQWMFQWASNIL